MKLAGKKALITGGNSGIGLATARLFISEDADLAISGRDQQTLDEAVAELGSKARGYRANVTVAVIDRSLGLASARKETNVGRQVRRRLASRAREQADAIPARD